MSSKRKAGSGQRAGSRSARKKKSTPRKPASRRKPLWRRALVLLVGLALGIGIPWVVYLNWMVTSEFEGRKWDLPSRVYARPLTLYPGLALAADDLATELEAAGYRKLQALDGEGSYTAAGGRFDIFRRAFRFDDGEQQSLRFQVEVSNGTVQSLREPQGQALDLVRLDPAQFASIWPLHAEDRTLVALADVPELLVTGLQAVEDRKFKSHHGIDPRGIARALYANLRAGGTVQGGSTLTQQLVKNYYLSNERTLLRKANEALMAVLLEWHDDKSQILEAYLNEVFLGQQGKHAIHGFARASEFYFGKPLERLQPQEIALLVVMVRGASLYTPRRNPERALQRRNQVLSQFAETGVLGIDEAAQATGRPLGVTLQPDSGRSRYPAFVELVRAQLQRDYQESDLRSEGLRIFTTLAPFEQQAAEKALRDGVRDLARRGLSAELQGAVVLVDTDSGEVRALVGDRDPGKQGFNRALNARRQVGSVIKPLVYLLALEHQETYSWLTRIEDEPISLRQADGSQWSPRNFDGTSHGEVSLLEALTLSYNQATVRLGMNIGVAHLVRKLAQLGVQVDIPAVPATLLGAIELTPLEVAQVYQSIAAGGFSVPLRAVTAVQTPQGGTLSRYPLQMLPLERRAALAVLNYGLTQVVQQGTARALPELLGSQVAVAGKTGTTNDARDSWFVGYTRDRVGVAWVGLDNNQPAGVTGSNAAMRVWARMFRELPLQPVSLDMPEGAWWVWVDPATGTLSDEDCPGAVQMPFIEGSEPATPNACLNRLDRKDDKKPFWRKWFGRD
jgi:penicillin-binding protein 1B